MKKQIEIDVPDGYEIVSVDQNIDHHTKAGISIPVLVNLIKKEPEFIEVRDYLWLDWLGKPVKLTLNKREFCNAIRTELDPNFIRWIDKEPRKVEI